MKYELVVVWYDGTKDIYEYNSEDKARKGEQGIRMASGHQISFTCIRPQLNKGGQNK